jgi:hypothetical protein
MPNYPAARRRAQIRVGHREKYARVPLFGTDRKEALQWKR